MRAQFPFRRGPEKS